MDILKNLRELIVIISMAAVLTGGNINQNNIQSVFTLENIDNVETWQENVDVKAAEKESKCSAVKIKLYKKIKYNLNENTIKTKEVFGLVKNEDFRKWWNKNIESNEEATAVKVENDDDITAAKKIQEEYEKLNIYDSKGRIVAIIKIKEMKELEIYNDGLLRATIEFSYSSRCEKIAYSKYGYKDGKMIKEEIGGKISEKPHICSY